MTRSALLGLCVVGVLASCLVGCDDAGAAQSGQSEDFRVRKAQFVRKPLPGTAAGDSGMMMAGADAGDAAPRIIQTMTSFAVILQGQGGKKFNGLASENTVAVGIALDQDSEGYWVVPVGALDPSPADPKLPDYTWDITADFGANIALGHHELLAVAIDKDGVASEQYPLPICVTSRVQNLHVCDDSKAPPRAVISLTWDTQVDLDLQVISPTGVVIDSKKPNTGRPGLMPADDGVIDRDSNASCNIDGVRAESLVWQKSIPHGVYGMYVNLFDSCKQPAVRFKIGVYTATRKESGKEELKLQFERSGELTAMSENGGLARGLFVSEFSFR